MAEIKDQPVPLTVPTSTTQPDLVVLSALIEDDALALRADLAAGSDGRIANVKRVAANVVVKETADLKAGSGNNGIPEAANSDVTTGEKARENGGYQRTEDAIDFASYDRAVLERRIRQETDYRGKLIAVRNSLKDLSAISRDVSDLRGWPLLMEAVKDLPHKELIDRVVWKQKFAWSDEQLDALNAQKQDQLVPPKELEDFFLELHKLLVASQAVLFELRQRGDKPVGQDDKLPERRILFAERLERIHVLAEEWRQLMGQYLGGAKRFPEAVAKAMGVKHALNVKEFVNDLAEQGKQHEWKGEVSKGDKSAAVKKLSFLERQVAAARALVAEMGVKPAVASGEPPSAEVRERMTNFGIQLNAAHQLMEQWYTLVRTYQGATRQGKKLYDQLREAGFEVDERQMGQWNQKLERASETFTQFRDVHVAGQYQDFIDEVTPKLREAVKAAQAAAAVLDATAGGATPVVPAPSSVAIPGQAPVTPAAAPASPDVASSPADPATPSAVPNREFRPIRNSLEILKTLNDFRNPNREMRYLDSQGEWYVVRPTKTDEMFELWYPDQRVERAHEKDVVDKLFKIGVEIVGKYPRGEFAVEREAREAREMREQFEHRLTTNIQVFVQRLDERLRSKGKDLEYRRSAVLAHLPKTLDALIEHLRGPIVLSSQEKTVMLKQYTHQAIDGIGE